MARADQIDLPKGCAISEFAPVAYYDKHMDCIRVLTHDRSVTEVRIDETFTVHRCNHPGPMDPKYVGFTIKGVKHLFNEIGLPPEGVIRLADIIDHIVKHRPGSAMSAIVDLIFNQHQSVGDFPVVFDDDDGGQQAA